MGVSMFSVVLEALLLSSSSHSNRISAEHRIPASQDTTETRGVLSLVIKPGVYFYGVKVEGSGVVKLERF